MTVIAEKLIYGPKGTRDFRETFFINNKSPFTTAPYSVDKKKTNKICGKPNTIPNKPKYFISSASMPPLLTTMIRNNKPKPTILPNIGDHHGSNGKMILMITRI